MSPRNTHPERGTLRCKKLSLHLLLGEYHIEAEYGKAYDKAPGE